MCGRKRRVLVLNSYPDLPPFPVSAPEYILDICRTMSVHMHCINKRYIVISMSKTMMSFWNRITLLLLPKAENRINRGKYNGKVIKGGKIKQTAWGIEPGPIVYTSHMLPNGATSSTYCERRYFRAAKFSRT